MSLYIAANWCPPAPAPTPLHDELAARLYVPLSDEAVWSLAAEWLADIGRAARAKAGIRPRIVSTDARDLTGAFPVVRAA